MAHITRYGNRYSDQEWKEVQEIFAEERKETEDWFATLDKMGNYLARQLRENGLSEKAVTNLVYSFKNFTFEEQLHDGKFQFSSQERENFIMDLWERWNKKMDEVMR